MTKKSTKHSTRTLEQFKEELSNSHYNTVVGARRGAAYLPEKDRDAALKLVAKKFGVGIDEPGEATRGDRRSKKVGSRKKTVKRVAAAAPPAKGKKKVAKKVSKKAARKPAEPEAAPAEAETAEASAPVPVAEGEAPVKKKRAVRGSKKADAKTAEANPDYTTPTAKGPLGLLGVASKIIPLVDQALVTIARAKEYSGGTLDITAGLRDVIDTTGAALKELRRHLPDTSELEHLASLSGPPSASYSPPEAAVYGDGNRPTNHQALQEAAAAAGVSAAVS